MREIKFKVYLGDPERFKETCESWGFTEAMADGLIEWDGDRLHPAIGDEGIKLCQYTGLKDKNGVEIYEGDIIRCRDSNILEVYYEDGIFDVQSHYCDFIDSLRNQYSGSEVIGNIYENPELLDD